MNNANWDDFRYVLAVAEHGSLNATAKSLGVTHVTVMRHVAAFEARYGQPIFHKSSSGYRVLPKAEPILAAARNVEDAVLSVERTILGSQRGLAGNVRVASTDSVCEALLPAAIERISEAYPKLTIAVLSANSHHDLVRLTADIAVRATMALEDGLDGIIAGRIHFVQYCAKADQKAEAAAARWLGLKGDLKRSAAAEWIAKNVPKEQIVHEADSFLVLREMAAVGLGRALLPSFLGDRDPRLRRLHNGEVGIDVPLWIASQEEIFDNARVRAVREALATELAQALVDPAGASAGQTPMSASGTR